MKRTKLLSGLCVAACAGLNFLALSAPGAQTDTEQTRSFPLATSPIIMLNGAHEEIQSGSATEFNLLSLDITHDTSGKLFGFARLDLNNVSTVTNQVVTTVTNQVVTSVTNEVVSTVTNDVVTSVTNEVVNCTTNPVITSVTNEIVITNLVENIVTNEYFFGSATFAGWATNFTVLVVTNHFNETNEVGTVTNQFGEESSNINALPFEVTTTVQRTNSVSGPMTNAVSIPVTTEVITWTTNNVYDIGPVFGTNLVSSATLGPVTNLVPFDVVGEAVVEVTNLATVEITNTTEVLVTNTDVISVTNDVVNCVTNPVVVETTNTITVEVTNAVITEVTNTVVGNVTNQVPANVTNITASLYGPISGSVNGTAGVKQKASISAKLEGVNPEDPKLRLSGNFSFTGTLEADALVVSGKGTLQNGNVKTSQTFENLTLETPTIASPVINADLFMMRLSGDENKGSGKLQAQGTMAIGEGSGDLLGSVSTKWDLGKSTYTEQGSLKGSGSSSGASVTWKVKSDSPDAGDATVSGKAFGQRFSEIAPFTP